MPSNQVYRFFQDKDGYVWMCTDRGLARFDGRNFHNLSLKDGLLDNVVLNVKPDGAGNHLCLTINGTFFELLNGGIIGKQFSIENDGMTVLGTGILDYSYKNQTPIISAAYEGSRIFQNKADWSESNVIDLNPEDQIYFHKEFELWSYNPLYTQESYYHISQSNTELRASINLNDVRWQGIKKGLDIPKSNWVVLPNNSYLFSIENSIFLVKDNTLQLVHTFEKIVLSLEASKLNPGLFFAGLKGNGIVGFELENDRFLQTEQALPGHFVSDYFEDSAGGVWISTLFNGLYYYPDFKGLSVTFIPENEQISCTRRYTGKTIIGTNRGKVFLFAENQLKLIYTGDGEVTSIAELDNILLISFSNYIVFFDLLEMEDRIHKLDKLHYLSYCKFTQSLDSHFISCAHRRIALFDKYGQELSTLSLIKDIIPKSKRTNDLLSVNGKIIVAGNDGIRYFKIAENGREFAYLGSELVGKKIIGLTPYRDSSVLITTMSSGIYEFDFETIREVKQDGERIYAPANCVTLLGDSILAFGLNTGLKLMALKNGDITKSWLIDSRMGLISNRITSVWADEYRGEFLMSTGKAMEVLQYEDIMAPLNAPIVLNDVLIDGQKANASNLVLPNSFFEMKLSFAVLDFAHGATMEYKYRLDTTKDNWIHTQNNEVSFTSLQPGRHTLQITTALGNTHEQNMIRLPILVKGPFYQSAWFISLLAFLFLLIAYIYFKTRIRKLETKQKLYKLEYSALNSQMNPHFLFNVLNSIQGYVFQGDKREASNFIDKFGRLIRHNLDLSEINQLSVNSEIEVLRNYLSLEKMRMNDRFDFEIKTVNFTADDLEHYLIPRMMLQPVLENAVLHGIRHLNRPGKIEVVFTKTEQITVEITDNGIGQAKSKELNSKRAHLHKSIAMKNIANRIRLMRESGQQKVNWETVDLTEEKNENTGTLVRFSFELLGM